MKTYRLLTTIVLCVFFVAPSVADDFKNKFFQAKSYLASGDVDRALSLYLELYKRDTTNSNLAYLIGVCYTDDVSTSAVAVEYLKKSVKNVSLDYDAGVHTEKKASVFAWYYMTIALSQAEMCSESIGAVVKFRQMYGMHKKDFYTRDAMGWAHTCGNEIEENPMEMDLELEIGAGPGAAKIVTKKVEYTARSPLYAVQIGAFSRLVPMWKFEGLNNVDAFMDRMGTIRYVMGHFNYVAQANTLLRAVWEAGYPDAFIVDINFARKFNNDRYSQEIVSVDDVSFKAKISGKVDFRVQIGAFKESIPDELVQLYLTLDGINETKEKDLTSLNVGIYDTYEEAVVKRGELTDIGIPGCFIVAYNYNRKVTVEEAKHFVSKQTLENSGE